MFSCFVLEKDRILTPTKCDLHYVSLGAKCSGRVSIYLTTDGDCSLNNAVLYVPSLLYHSSGENCEVRLTSCNIKKDTLPPDELTLMKWQHNNGGPSSSSDSYPVSYTDIWNHINKVVLKYGCAQSSNDTIIFIGDIKNKLTLTMSFIMNITPVHNNSTGSNLVSCHYMSMLPAKETSLKVTLEIPDKVHVSSVLATPQVSSFSHNIAPRRVIAEILHTNDTQTGIIMNLTLLEPLVGQSHVVFLPDSLSVNENMTCDGVQLVNYFFSPPSTTITTCPVLPGEFIFMVDCSGSMSGQKIRSASESLLLALKSLPDGCYFNIVAFGSKFRTLYQSSMGVTSHRAVEQGIHFANQLDACLGGTELLTPIRWVFKRPPPTGLMRHFILITDGGVPNVRVILQTAAKQRLNTKFHTFALGSDICYELMAGLASITEGSYRVIKESDRIQTKVMEVLQSSLTPALSNVSIKCTPPQGYTEVLPGTELQLRASSMFPKTSDAHYIVLKKLNGSNLSLSLPPSHTTTMSTIAGNWLGQTIQCSNVVSTSIDMASDHCYTLLQSIAWARIDALKEKLSCHHRSSRHRSADSDHPPPTKVSCHYNNTDHHLLFDAIKNDLVTISIRSGVSCYPHTQFQSNGEGGYGQVTPWNSHQTPINKKDVIDSNTISINVPIRKRPRERHNPSSSSPSSSSFSSLAKQTVSGLTRAAVNLVTFGYFDTDPPVEQSGHRIEDQEYYQNKSNRLHWNKQHELILPDFYYTTNNTTSEEEKEREEELRSSSIHDLSHLSSTDSPSIEEEPLPPEQQQHCAGNKQAYYIPLVEMQLLSGAWPLHQPLSVITSIPMKKIIELPTSNGSVSHNKAGQGHVWATALAIAFLRTHCAMFETEWKLLVVKAQNWLESQNISIPHINNTATELLTMCQ